MTTPFVRLDARNMRELRMFLRDAQGIDSRPAVKQAFREGAEVVAEEARMRANPFSFRIADTIRAGAGVSAGRPQAFVRGGKAAYPWYGWADFGSRTPRRGQPRSVGPWANSGPGPRGGRFIYPAIDFKEREVVEKIDAGLERAFRQIDT